MSLCVCSLKVPAALFVPHRQAATTALFSICVQLQRPTCSACCGVWSHLLCANMQCMSSACICFGVWSQLLCANMQCMSSACFHLKASRACRTTAPSVLLWCVWSHQAVVSVHSLQGVLGGLSSPQLHVRNINQWILCTLVDLGLDLQQAAVAAWWMVVVVI